MPDLNHIPSHKPVLIAGPTASGKSALALRIATEQGGVILNADAIQVYENWRILTARPSTEDERLAPHGLYGHVSADFPYSVGHWLRDLDPFLNGSQRPIIIGGTGLYFSALTQGLADIPLTPDDIRQSATQLIRDRGLSFMIDALDDKTRRQIDTLNPMRVQRAWEVLQTTGQGLADWQENTPPPRLPLNACTALLVTADKTWLNDRIESRFHKMIDAGALTEAEQNLSTWRPTSPSAKAIGAPELIAHLKGEISLDDAINAATIATRQFAKRQRSWFRSKMKSWQVIEAEGL